MVFVSRITIMPGKSTGFNHGLLLTVSVSRLIYHDYIRGVLSGFNLCLLSVGLICISSQFLVSYTVITPGKSPSIRGINLCSLYQHQQYGI